MSKKYGHAISLYGMKELVFFKVCTDKKFELTFRCFMCCEICIFIAIYLYFVLFCIFLVVLYSYFCLANKRIYNTFKGGQAQGPLNTPCMFPRTTFFFFALMVTVDRSGLQRTSAFNSEVTEQEGKIDRRCVPGKLFCALTWLLFLCYSRILTSIDWHTCRPIY